MPYGLNTSSFSELPIRVGGTAAPRKLMLFLLCVRMGVDGSIPTWSTTQFQQTPTCPPEPARKDLVGLRMPRAWTLFIPAIGCRCRPDRKIQIKTPHEPLQVGLVQELAEGEE